MHYKMFRSRHLLRPQLAQLTSTMFRTTIHRTLRLARPLSSTSAVQTATETINRRVGQTLASGLGMAQHAMEEAAKPGE
jgi:hypothetical protein